MYISYTKELILQYFMPLFVCLAILLLAFLLFPNVYQKMFVSDPNPGFGDTPYYIGIAKDGYSNPAEWAYYPLYPLFTKVFGILLPLPLEKISVVLSISVFLVSIPVTVVVFKKLLHEKLYLIFILLYLTNPMIIFHYLGYTESLFSLLLIIYIYFLSSAKPSLFLKVPLIFILSILISLTRPVLLQFIFSVLLALSLMYIIRKETSREEFILGIVSVAGVLVGYMIFGVYAWYLTGDFFKPFTVQSLWDKKVGLYLHNLWAKGTTMDIIALYMGIFISIYLVYKVLKYLKSGETEFVPKKFEFWFSIGILISHVAIVFFTQDGDLRSLGRYVFSIPTTFLALGMLIPKPSRLSFVILYFTIFLSSISLLYWFYMYSNTLWVG
ncbi:MAG: hypothetical protein N2712_03245 [Brevinematales bacterium]|nr:hypothetical protein [Brevinematales bacterium]